MLSPAHTPPGHPGIGSDHRADRRSRSHTAVAPTRNASVSQEKLLPEKPASGTPPPPANSRQPRARPSRPGCAPTGRSCTADVLAQHRQRGSRVGGLFGERDGTAGKGRPPVIAQHRDPPAGAGPARDACREGSHVCRRAIRTAGRPRLVKGFPAAGLVLFMNRWVRCRPKGLAGPGWCGPSGALPSMSRGGAPARRSLVGRRRGAVPGGAARVNRWGSAVVSGTCRLFPIAAIATCG